MAYTAGVQDHSAAASLAHQQNLCNMLQVSKAWKAALLQAAAGQIDITIRIERLDQLSRITSLAPWLRKYGACVGSLKIPCHLPWTIDPKELSSRLRLQLKAVSQLAESLEGGVLDHNTLSLVPWSSLRVLNINLPVDGGLLAVLPTGLSELAITTKASSTDFAALRRLKNLRSLDLKSESDVSRVPQSVFEQLSSLTSLTTLLLYNPAQTIDWRQVPRSLEVLGVQDWDYWQPTGGMQLRLAHIGGLTKLRLICDGVLSGSQLPVSLRDLHITKEMRADMLLVPLGVAGSTALTRLWLKTTGAGHALGLLAPLLQLQMVDISWAGELHELISVASALPYVPGELSLQAAICSDAGVDLDDYECIMQQLGALTRLTSLVVGMPAAQGALGAADAESLAICKHLSSLASLQKLSIIAERAFVKHDVQHLTDLRSLTWLSLYPRSPNAEYSRLVSAATFQSMIKVILQDYSASVLLMCFQKPKEVVMAWEAFLGKVVLPKRLADVQNASHMWLPTFESVCFAKCQRQMWPQPWLLPLFVHFHHDVAYTVWWCAPCTVL